MFLLRKIQYIMQWFYCSTCEAENNVCVCVFVGIAAIGQINEALDEGDPSKTLAMLQNPSAKLLDVDPSVAQHYHDKLLEARREKAHVGAQTHAHTHTGSAFPLNCFFFLRYSHQCCAKDLWRVSFSFAVDLSALSVSD